MRFYFPPIDLDKQTPGQLLAPNLVAYYTFDGAAGDNEADAGGSAEPMVQTNSPPSVAGKVGTARDCQVGGGTDRTFTIAGPHSFHFAGELHHRRLDLGCFPARQPIISAFSTAARAGTAAGT